MPMFLPPGCVMMPVPASVAPAMVAGGAVPVVPAAAAPAAAPASEPAKFLKYAILICWFNDYSHILLNV